MAASALSLGDRVAFGRLVRLALVAATLVAATPVGTIYAVECGDVCGDACCDECSECGCFACGSAGNGEGAQHFWVTGEYLVWAVDGQALPPLITSAPAGTPLAQAGALGQPGTTILAGNETVNNDYRSGFRISGGYWLDPCSGLAIVGDYFWLGGDDYDRLQRPTGDIITRPFFNTQTGQQDSELVDVPDELRGTARIGATSDFDGAGIGLQQCLWSCADPCTQRRQWIALVGGYRNYNYDTTLGVREDLQVLPNTTSNLVPGTQIVVQDDFRATNEFHGGEIGLAGRLERYEFWLDGLAAMAIGGNEREVFINGSTQTTVPNAGSSTAQGGLLTSEVTNIGSYRDTSAVVIPRFRLGVGVQILPRLSARAGYNVILWNNVAQAATSLPPGLAVDPRNLPPVQAGGTPDPRFPGIIGNSIAAHGFDFGLTFQY